MLDAWRCDVEAGNLPALREKLLHDRLADARACSDDDGAAGVIPSLSPVHIDGVRIGRTAAELIITRAAGGRMEQPQVDVSFSIVPRESA